MSGEGFALPDEMILSDLIFMAGPPGTMSDLASRKREANKAARAVLTSDWFTNRLATEANQLRTQLAELLTVPFECKTVGLDGTHDAIPVEHLQALLAARPDSAPTNGES